MGPVSAVRSGGNKASLQSVRKQGFHHLRVVHPPARQCDLRAPRPDISNARKIKSSCGGRRAFAQNAHTPLRSLALVLGCRVRPSHPPVCRDLGTSLKGAARWVHAPLYRVRYVRISRFFVLIPASCVDAGNNHLRTGRMIPL